MDTATQVAPFKPFDRVTSRSIHTRRPTSSECFSSSSNHSAATLRSSARKKTGGLDTSSSRVLRCRAVLAVLLAPTLRRLVLATLLLSLVPFRADAECRDFGATITSASGAIFTKACEAPGVGSKLVTSIFAVDVGVKCKVRGWCDRLASMLEGFGKARTCDKKFISRKRACNSMTVRHQRHVTSLVLRQTYCPNP